MTHAAGVLGVSPGTRDVQFPPVLKVFAVGVALAFLAAVALPVAPAANVRTLVDNPVAAMAAAWGALAAGFVALNILHPRNYRPTLWALAPLVPIAAIAATAAAAMFLPAAEGTVQPSALALGTLAAVALWVIGSAAVREVSSAEVAAGRAFQQVDLRYRQLERRLAAVEAGTGTGIDPTVRQAALTEAHAQLEWVGDALRDARGKVRSGYSWSMATGYVNCSRALHRVEEALIEVEPVDMLASEGLHDYFSLRDSRIPNRDALMTSVRQAVARIEPTLARDFFESTAGRAGRQTRTAARLARRGASPAGHGVTAGGTSAVTTWAANPNDPFARAALREVRFALSQYRDDTLDGIVRQRNRLWRAILVTSLVTYAMLGLGIMARVSVTELQATSAIFLTGAVIGLFNQLRLAGSWTSSVEDFGLSEALLVQVPIVSGLAAVAGVVATTLLSPVATGGAATAAPALSEMFSPARFAPSLLIAAVFGLSPALLVDRFRKETRELQSDYASSAPTRKDEAAGQEA